MQFEEIQRIWEGQNDEQLFDINQAALHKAIGQKSRSARRWLELLEWIMIGVNLIVGIVLIADTLSDTRPNYQFIIAVMYLGYSISAFFRRLTRRQQEARFEETVLGELNKAIWHIDQLITWSRSMPLKYVLPLALVGTLSLYLNSTPWWRTALLLLLAPATYYGVRWEINKWHLPKKRALESLREHLLASETQ